MVVNGIVRPQQITVTHGGRKQPRFMMVYQEPGEKPVPLCGIQITDMPKSKPMPAVCKEGQHVSSLQARRCATAVEWHRQLQLYGYTKLEVIRAKVAVLAAARAEREKAKAGLQPAPEPEPDEKKGEKKKRSDEAVTVTASTGRSGRTNNRVR